MSLSFLLLLLLFSFFFSKSLFCCVFVFVLFFGWFLIFHFLISSKVGEQKFSAHRVILAATIPYFNAMFTNDMVEANMNEITMEGIEPR